MEIFLTYITQLSKFIIPIIIFIFAIILREKPFNILKYSLYSLFAIIILFTGIDLLTTSFSKFIDSFNLLFETKSITSSFEDYLTSYSSFIGIILLVGVLTCFLFAKFTRFKVIYLNGSNYLWYAMLLSAVIIELQINYFLGAVLVLVFYTIILVIVPYFLKPIIFELTNQENLTIGHSSSTFIFIGYYLGKLFSKNKSLKIKYDFKNNYDPIIITYVLLLVLFFIIQLFIIFTQKTGFSFHISDTLLNPAYFVAGILLIVYAANLLLENLMPIFKRVSHKHLENASAALDVATILKYDKSSVIICFIISTITSLLFITLLGVSNLLVYALIPNILGLYFDVSPGAMFANLKGGVYGLITYSVLGGIIQVLLMYFSLFLISNTVGDFVQIYGGNQYSLWIIIFYSFSKIFKR